MTTHLTRPPPLTPARTRLPVPPTLALGGLGGFALGVLARAWMRLISEDPEFTWTGTAFVVAGFTIFGLAQSIVAVARGRVRRPWRLAIVRAIGAIAMLPLFVAAGAAMLPTVIGGGLAFARTEWRPITRGSCVVVAAIPVLFVGHDLVDSFGWSLRTVAGLAGLLAIYATIIWASHFTLAGQPDGWKLSRRAKTLTALAIAATVSVLFIAGGGFQ